MIPATSRAAVWAVVPAAGVGRRMGWPKQTLPLEGGTIAATVARTLLGAGADGVVVVTRSELVAALLLPQDARIVIALNNRAGSEMIDSVRVGWKAAGALFAPHGGDGVLVVPADMPHLTIAACRDCIRSYRHTPERVVVATHAGKRGHPLIVPWALRPHVEALRGGLNGLLRPGNLPVHEVETGAEAVGDVDTWGDYERLTGRRPLRPSVRL
ncbi:MAG: nucleotidyltransferase family protein [Planctomycetes bacterium]|nr:nucleotidyltransferase family protein [Planctomycetota bacterium]